VAIVTFSAENSGELPSRKDLVAEIAAASTLHGDFVLRSGQHTAKYFDKYQFEALPHLLAPIADWLTELTSPDTEVLAGLELGGIPLSTAMSLRTGIPCVFVRKAAKRYGTCKAIEGPDVSGRIVTVVEDVVTTGGQIVESVRLLRDEGAVVRSVVCVIWRGESLDVLQAADLELRSAMTAADLA
jgi:orotate phosphoribosyltransferase